MVNSVLIQQYHVSGMILTVNMTSTSTKMNVNMSAIYIGEENVTRSNVAEVDIDNNTSRVLFRENKTAETLWPGKYTQCMTTHILAA